MQEPEFSILFDAFDDAGCADEGVGGGHFDGVDGSPIDLGSDNDSNELYDGDFLSQLYFTLKWSCWLVVLRG